MKRFFDKISKTDNCWNWKASLRGKTGYGAFKINDKVVDAHRVSYILHYGEIPKNMFVCHKCDNRKCVNPDHLFLGTHSDNIKDAYNKGRLKVPKGVKFTLNNLPKNANIKNKKDIVFIKEKIKNRTVSLKQLSIELNIPYQTLRDINSGRTYKSY